MYVILRLLSRRGFTLSTIQEHPAALEPLGKATVPFEAVSPLELLVFAET